jgi:uncharacterized protein
LELHSATGQAEWLDRSEQLAQQMLDEFEDKTAGGFYFTGPSHEKLLLRSKNLLGGGNLPLGNGVAAQSLLELHDRTGRAEYLQAAEASLRCFAELMLRAPRQVEHLVLANAQYVRRNGLQPTTAPDGEVVPQADARHRDQAVASSLYLSALSAAPGETLQVAVQLDIQSGFHLYTDPTPEEIALQPTRLRLEESPDFALGPVEYPAGVRKEDPVWQKPLEIYSGTISVFAPLRISSDAPLGEHRLKFVVEYQACDAQRCLAPQSIALEATFRVGEPATEELRHEKIFDRRELSSHHAPAVMQPD